MPTAAVVAMRATDGDSCACCTGTTGVCVVSAARGVVEVEELSSRGASVPWSLPSVTVVVVVRLAVVLPGARPPSLMGATLPYRPDAVVDGSMA